jgi:hypothetical protein
MGGYLLNILLLCALIKLLMETESPLLCASLYTGVSAFFNLLFGAPWSAILISGALSFGLAFLYFWLLDRFEDGSAIWWVILIGGIFVGLV